MKSKKEMRQAIKVWVSGLPGREWSHSIISKVGRDYVYCVSLYSGSEVTRYTIEEFYNDRLPESWK